MRARRQRRPVTLADLVDLHVHILPGVDDGPGTVAEVVEMLRIAHRGQTRRLVATPHMFSPVVPSLEAPQITD